MVCEVCRLVSLVVRGVMIIGKWSDEMSVYTLQIDEEQKVMCGEVGLCRA
jgi:hypothetical protein